MHEAIEHGGKKLYSDIAVTHRSVKKVYGERNLNIYRRQLREGPPMAPRDTFYYARELYYHRYYEQAEQVLTEFLEQGHGYLENNLEALSLIHIFIEIPLLRSRLAQVCLRSWNRIFFNPYF